MVKYLKVKARKGELFELYFRGKRTWGDKALLFDLYIRRGQMLLIFGGKRSGKSENLQKIINNAGKLWGTSKGFIVLKASNSVAEWCRCDAYVQWTKKEVINKNVPASVRNEFFIEWCVTHNSIIFIDDYDKLSPTKQDIVERAQVGNTLIATFSDDCLPLELMTSSFSVDFDKTMVRLSPVPHLKFSGRMWYGFKRLFQG